MNEHDAGELVDTVTTDPLRAAFAAAMGALIQALPPSHVRDTALEQIIEAHARTEHALSRTRVLH